MERKLNRMRRNSEEMDTIGIFLNLTQKYFSEQIR